MMVNHRAIRVPAWRRYLRFWGSDPARDLDDELRFHIRARYDEYLASGMPPDVARVEVARRFGDFDAVREQCLEIDSQWKREQTMSDLLHRAGADVRYAARQLRRNASLSAVAVLCLAVGIGANVAIFSVVNGVLFRPLPFADPNRLVLVGEWLPSVGGENFGVISRPEFTDYQRLNGRIFANTAIYDGGAGNQGTAISGDGSEPERVTGLRVSASLFPTLGVHAALGRTFDVSDDSAGGLNAVILSDALWRNRFGARDVIGRSIAVDGRPRTIIGVMPASFTFPLAGIGGEPADVFMPIHITAEVEQERGNSYSTFLVARLAPGVTMDQAKRAVSELVASYPALHPEAYRSDWKTEADVFPMRDRSVRDVRRPLVILLGAVGFVLLIACINVSSLLLARAAARKREIAVRQALGASRGRLVQQFLWEGATLAMAGAALGMLLAVWGTRTLVAHAPQQVLQGYSAAIDLRVLVFTASVVIVTSIVFSLVPALTQSASRLGVSLREEGRASTSGSVRVRGRRALVIAQVALALVLSTGAGLLARSFLEARGTNPGFSPEHVVTFRVRIPEARYRSAASVIEFDRRCSTACGRFPAWSTRRHHSGFRWRIRCG